MRCYLVTAGDSNVYAATQALAREARAQLVSETHTKKKDITIAEVEVPTAKAQLIEFINNLITR
jgi:hypothetical protein